MDISTPKKMSDKQKLSLEIEHLRAGLYTIAEILDYPTDSAIRDLDSKSLVKTVLRIVKKSHYELESYLYKDLNMSMYNE
jgi:hypothetical protein